MKKIISKSNNKLALQKSQLGKRKISGQDLVLKMLITIERNGVRTTHPLSFSHDPLPISEMYAIGFLGDIEFEHQGGIIEKAEVEAGPKGEFDGDVVGRFVFKVVNRETKNPIDAKVVKFNFFKTGAK